MFPDNPKHKSIICVDNYKLLDGHYVYTSTDAESISVGYAQFDNTNPDELTAKVFRRDSHSGRWFRQSEEIPLHRCVDLCNLIVQSIMKAEGINYGIVSTSINPTVKKDLSDIKSFYERMSTSNPSRTYNQLREKLRELRILIDILNP